jgi:spermidine/putrescine transport system permease protein
MAGLLIFFLAPIATFAVYSFLTAGLYAVAPPLTFENYREALSSPLVRTLGWNSLMIGVLAAVASVIVGLPVAYWLRYLAGRLRVPVLFLILGTIFASYLVRIYAWRTILGETGILNEALQRLGLIERPLGFILYSRFAVTIALVQIYLPYVVLVLFAAFGPITPALVESAQDLGANIVQRWRKLLLPLVAGPALTCFLLVFVLSASDYVTPQLLGGTNGVTLGVHIQTIMTGVGNWGLGGAVSLLMLAAFALCYGLTTLGLRLVRLDRLRWET